MSSYWTISFIVVVYSVVSLSMSVDSHTCMDTSTYWLHEHTYRQIQLKNFIAQSDKPLKALEFLQEWPTGKGSWDAISTISWCCCQVLHDHPDQSAQKWTIWWTTQTHFLYTATTHLKFQGFAYHLYLWWPTLSFSPQIRCPIWPAYDLDAVKIFHSAYFILWFSLSKTFMLGYGE